MDRIDDFGAVYPTDILDAADLIRKQRKEAIACGVCGNPEPVRVEKAGCEACVAFPRCVMCGRWTDLDVPSRAMVWDGLLVDVCDICWEKVS
jgi:hypothetical protein